MGFGDGALGALVAWVGLVLAINQVCSAVAFTTQWRSNYPRKFAFIAFFALSYLLQATAILLRGDSIIALPLLVIAIPVSALLGLFWSALFAADFYPNVRVRVAFILGLISLALSCWLTYYIGPKVGYWRAWSGITDQILFRAWSYFLALSTAIQVLTIGSLVVKIFPTLTPIIERKTLLVSLGLGLGAVTIPSLIVVVNPTYPVMLLIYVGICYLVGWITLLVMQVLSHPPRPIGAKIGSILSYHSGVALGFLLMILIGKVTGG